MPGFVFRPVLIGVLPLFWHVQIRYLRNGKGTGDAPVSYWPFLTLFLVTVPEVFAKINSAQSPRFSSGDSSDMVVFLDKDEKPVGPIW